MSNFNIIRTLSEEKKMTLREIANEIGISESGLQKIIRTGSTNTKTIESIAKLLDVPVGTFFEKMNIYQKNNKNNINAFGNNITISDCESDLKEARKEIEHFKKLLEEKERILNEKERMIQLLMNKK